MCLDFRSWTVSESDGGKNYDKTPGVWLLIRSYGKGTGIVIPKNLDRVMGMGSEPGMFVWIVFFWESLSSLRMCFQGFLTNFLGVEVCQKKAFFRWTFQIIMTLTPPPVFWNWEPFYSLTKKCPWWWLSILRHTDEYILYVTMWPVSKYVYMYIHIYINVCMHMYMSTCKCM